MPLHIGTYALGTNTSNLGKKFKKVKGTNRNYWDQW